MDNTVSISYFLLFYYFHFVVFLPHSAQKLLFTGNIPRGVFWNQIDWKKAEEQVNRLQIRIVKATLEQKWRLIKRLQYLITNSFYAKALTVRRGVTNSGKKTPGIDGVLWKADKKKWKQFSHSMRRPIMPENPPSPVIIGFDGCFLLIYLQKSGFDYFWGTEVQEILYCELYPHMTEVTCFQTL